METDVLIVGAGPTGLMLANQLARRNVRAMIIDKNPGPSTQTKALGVQARTLEIYAHLGIAEDAVKRGARATGANMWAGGRRMARVPLGEIGREISPYPFLLILGQDENERLLAEALRRFNVAPQWNTELIHLEQTEDHVTATLKHPDGATRAVTAGWVAGCDGAHSAVRRLSGIAFPGAPYDHVFFIADTRMTGPMVPGELNVYLWEDGFHLFFPMPGADHWRVVGIVPPALRARTDLEFDAVVPSIRQEAGLAVSIQSCDWFSTYRIHHRRAERFRNGRCFLLGDAAHIHSPVGAQGMNTGLQDAYNLGWKLALVASGRADGRLLDSFEAERIPVAERLLHTTDRLFALVVSDRRLAALIRTRVAARVLAVAMRIDRVRKLAFRTISQTGIHYRNSPLTQSPTGWPPDAPRAGDRFPWLRLKRSADGPIEDGFAMLDDTRFNLVLIGQPAAAGELANHAGLVRVHEVPGHPVNAEALRRARIESPSFFLLRPDGHIGLAGTRFDGAAVNRYLAERLGLR